MRRGISVFVMVIHNSSEATSSSAIVLQSNLAPNKYLVVKNHVREIDRCKESPKLEESDHEEVNRETVKARKRKSTKVIQDKGKNLNTSEISKCDLQELRQVYFQCKSVLKKIETKYGCLLNLSDEIQDNSEELDSEGECKCNQNKRIAFDDNGKQILKDPVLEKHICVKKLKLDGRSLPVEKSNLKIEYADTSENSIMLPDSLQDLVNMLKQPDINSRMRRNVINKIKRIRQDYVNELRYDKKLLVQQLKANPPDDLLGFEGTNLSTIVGYPA